MPRESRATPGRKRRLAVLAVVLIAGCGGASDPPQDMKVESLTVKSRAVKHDMAVKVLVPAGGAAGKPLLVFLHGRGGDENAYLHEPLYDAVGQLGDRAPVVAFPDGADDKYWHDRDSGAWGRYVTAEVIPQVSRRFGTDRRRVAIGGISMGGFGAYDIAARHPDRFCAVGGHSPALWRSGGETAPGAFDDAEDFAAHDVIARAAALDRLPVWLDAGDDDPFRPGDDAFATALERAGADASVHTWSGGHDGEYWDAHWRDYLRFYARALRRC
jgi:enterochelin esterase-like enzyme